jgi:DNA helicase-2/ATP-dependent DNA helicase PcrA
MAEERRLFYVGVTRAKERLYLLRTFRRTLYGESEIREPSRFLADVPAHLVRDSEGRREGRQTTMAMGAGRFLGRSPLISNRSSWPARGGPERSSVPPKTEAARFHTGDQVEHDMFGRGVVIESQWVGGDEQVTVAFAGVGLKRLMASMAPMELAGEGD